jgi:hypothetical protein
MIRYVLLDHFFVGSTSSNVSQTALKLVKAPGPFPGQAIYETYKNENYLAPALLSIAEYSSQIVDEEGNPVESVLHHEDDLLLWAQRQYLTQWFPDFDPTQYTRDQDLPYDIDHIIAQNLLDRRGRDKSGLPKEFVLFRDGLLHCVGNKRIWPKGENRRDNNKNPEKKHLLGRPDQPLPANASLRYPPCCMEQFIEVRTASCIHEDELEDWRQANTGERSDHDWDSPERMQAFRRAVDARRRRLYADFFNTVNFGRWLTVSQQ